MCPMAPHEPPPRPPFWVAGLGMLVLVGVLFFAGWGADSEPVSETASTSLPPPATTTTIPIATATTAPAEPDSDSDRPGFLAPRVLLGPPRH